MKVLITTDLYTTATNGVVTSVRNLSRELEEAGNEVKILTLSDTVHSHREGNIYYIHSMPLKVYPDVRMPLPRTSHSQKLLKEIIQWKPDIIHSQCEFFSFHYARRIAKRTGAPLVHTYHTQYEQYVSYVLPGRWAGDFLVRTFSRERLKKVDIIIAPTAKMKQVLEDYGVKNDIEIVPSGICLQQHQGRMTEQEREQMRQLLGIPQEHRVVLNLGRLGTEKNLDEVVRLFALQLQRQPNLTLLIVGDGPAREKLCQQAKELGISDHVIFTGMVEPDQVQKYYQLGDVFVSASTSETQGLTYIEAAANGLPLVCREDPCLEGVISQGENGYTYRSPDEFLDEMDKVLADPDWCVCAGQKSEQIASAYGREQFAQNIQAVYQAAMSGSQEA
ncbi:MAG: glycosyltransferase family 4 protein [Firmicutes bacterium]|nr:glycosyltransferase family 4 protein [Bacillota bacterium]MDY6161335.1 glycosyltransferase family 4 protein [Candidatus Faecousia sp.]